ncbi:condensation domain-containing protein [Nonomuraea muscovyensis]|uniref:Condensation domain-containing protein n=1 Tax=Nonomuraea muscovyensis TaxID=1124761 RepID=A0A7X0F0F7_9ACTN|nr:condensation domain-containing protein [Nonomuraea muscovyensis]MBB6347810.1 hypothetical protein [Nonomuraea muscovyensis]
MTVREAPATVGQRLLWMMGHYRATEEYGTFNCPVLCRLRGRLDRAALGAAVNGLVRRHESLRTVFAGRGRDLLQRVLPAEPVGVDWRDAPQPPAPADLEAQLAAELRTRIDVGLSPIRVTCWQVSDTDHVLCLNLHHMVTDAWSTGVLFKELQTLYAHGGDLSVLPEMPWQYLDFARWQRHQTDSGALDRQRGYWLRQLDGARLARPPRLPGAGSAASGPTGVAAVTLPADVTRALKDVARDLRVTLFSVLLAGYFAQLHRATGDRDLTVASLFANRSRPESRGTVGFLANMAMLRSRRADADPRLLIKAAHVAAVGAFANEQQPFQTLPPRLIDTGGLRADDVVFQVVTDPQYKGHAGGLEFELLVPDAIGSRFSFELAVAPLGTGLRPVLFYRRDWFADAWSREFIAGYGDLLRSFTKA